MKLTVPPPNINMTSASLLIKMQNDPLVAKFLEREDNSVLDVGCGLPDQLWDLYHDVGIKNLSGIDRETENQIIQHSLKVKWKTIVPEGKKTSIKTMFDLYGQYTVVADPSTFELRPPILDVDEYNERFNIQYETEWLYETQFNPGSFDYLVLSNSIHLNVDLNGNQSTQQYRTRNFFNMAVNTLKKEGLIFIRVPHQNAANTDLLKHIRFNEDNFFEFIGDSFKEIHFEVESDKPKNIEKNSLLFLGVKK